MAFLISSTDVAIALAVKAETLRLVERTSRFGDKFICIEDDVGVIEVQDDMPSAIERVKAIEKIVGP